ncbi:hypothetical protein OAK15_01030 [Verrucomicrobia bacterium]|nr:hypothetical protein [Verrucomicrobiota bacterium]
MPFSPYIKLFACTRFSGLLWGAILVGLLTFTVPELTLANGFWKDKAR